MGYIEELAWITNERRFPMIKNKPTFRKKNIFLLLEYLLLRAKFFLAIIFFKLKKIFIDT